MHEISTSWPLYGCVPMARDFKLPKQWMHWAASMHLKPEIKRSKFRGFYLVGRGRRWRVNSDGYFQMSEREENFDRWANSVEATANIPTCRNAFQNLVRLMEKSQ